MKTVVYGGSFDPPHLGHTQIIKEAIAYLRPCRVLVVPAYLSMFKEGHGASYDDRCNMVRWSLAESLSGMEYHNVEVDELERNAHKRVSTVEALRQISNRHPNDELFVLVGGDILERLNDWKEPAELAELCTFLVGLRSGATVTVPVFQHPFRIELLRRPVSTPTGGPISSTMIRRTAENGWDYSNMVTPAVADFIKRNGLYAKKEQPV